MNNLAAINHAPTLLQAIARKVSAIATLIGKVAFVALSYFVATLQAVPPLLPLMIVIAAGITIAAMIIRNVLYPDPPSGSHPPTNSSQNTGNDSSTSSSQSHPAQNTSKTRRTRVKRANPEYPMPVRIAKPINRSSSESDSKPANRRISSSDNSDNEGKVSNPLDFPIEFIYKPSQENIDEISEFPREVDMSILADEALASQMTPSSSIGDLEKLPESVESHINVSTHSSFSAISAATTETAGTEGKNKLNPIHTLGRTFSSIMGRKPKEPTGTSLTNTNVNSFRSSSTPRGSKSKSETGDSPRSSVAFNLTRSFFGPAVVSQKKISTTIPNPPLKTAATTDNISKGVHRNIDDLKGSFKSLAAKLQEEKNTKASAHSLASQSKTEEPVKSKDEPLTEEWLFGKENDLDQPIIDNSKLPTVMEVADETASVSSDPSITT